MSNNSENNSKKSKKFSGKKIFQLLTSDIVFFVIFILYIIILAVVLIREFHISDFRATNQFLIILGFLFIPLFLILGLGYVLRNFEHIKIELGDEQRIDLKKEFKNEVTTELVENINTSTESTLYSLVSYMIVEPKTGSSYIQNTRSNSNQIIVGCQDYTEQHILCAIITELLKRNETQLEVVPKYNLGGVGLNFIALSRGDIDIYPAYTWQGFEMVYGTYLSQKRESLITGDPNSGEANDRIQELTDLYEDLSIPLKWICYTGFYDNWNIVVKKDYADKNEIKMISHLIKKECQPLRLACEYDFFARPNGYRLLTSPDGYGLKFEKISLIDHKQAYEALKNDEVNIIDGFTTDSQINDSPYKILTDDKKQFGRYYSSILVRKQLLTDRDNLEQILNLLAGKISSEKMTKMIEQIDQGSKTLENTAKEFLNNNVPNRGKLNGVH